MKEGTRRGDAVQAELRAEFDPQLAQRLGDFVEAMLEAGVERHQIALTCSAYAQLGGFVSGDEGVEIEGIVAGILRRSHA